MTVDETYGNAIIAVFMNRKLVDNICEFCKKDVTEEPICTGDSKRNKRSHFLGGLVLQLKYHEDWNWLMEVFGKIRLIVKDYEGDNFKQLQSRYKPICNELMNENIEGTWYCILKFIEWYNENKKS